MRRGLAVSILVSALIGCGGETRGSSGTGGGGGEASEACAPGELDGGTGCAPPGQDAGIPPEGCGPGTQAMDGGCLSTTPSCGPGMVAFVGEERCHALDDCASGTWGDIPSTASTLYVNAVAPPDGDGSPASPFATLAEAMAAAVDGDTIALAAGDYGDVDVDRAVTIQGRCPSMVSIGGTLTSALRIVSPATIRGVALSGTIGAEVFAGPTVLEEIWVHDVGDFGIVAQVAITLRRSLVETGADGAGVHLFATGGTIEDVVVRGGTRGINLFNEGMRVEAVTVSRAVVEGTSDGSVFAEGIELTLEDSVLRDAAEDTGFNGFGIQLQGGPAGPSSMTMRRSIVSNHLRRGLSIVTGSVAHIEHSVIRDTRPNDGMNGRGLVALEATEVAVVSSVIDDNVSAGLLLRDSDAMLDRVLVRGTRPQPADGRGGRAVSFDHLDPLSPRPELVVRGSRIEDNFEAGIGATGGTVLVESTSIADTAPSEGGIFGRGISVQASPTDGVAIELTVLDSVVERCSEAAILAGSASVVVERTTLRDVGASSFGNGVGLFLQPTLTIEQPPMGQAIARTLRIEQVVGAAIVAFDAEIDLEDATLLAIAARDDGTHGDGIVLTSGSVPVSGTMRSGRIEGASRAGVALFSFSMDVSAWRFMCNAIHLNGEGDFGLLDGGGNECGCGEVFESCKVISAMLAPPEPLE